MTLKRKIMQEKIKLSYMQMQEWIHTMILMAIARVLSPERDSPYLGFLLSLPDGVPDEDTFLRHSFLVAGFVLIAFAFDSSNSLRRIHRLAFL